jgi:hypothetical protein
LPRGGSFVMVRINQRHFAVFVLDPLETRRR